MRGATSSRIMIFFKIPRFQSTLLMRGATRRRSAASAQSAFQSTLLMRGATLDNGQPLIAEKISIHAPHARSDGATSLRKHPQEYFNPRSSCEERRTGASSVMLPPKFQSTLLMRGATFIKMILPREGGISIHAPHARSDVAELRLYVLQVISIHAPHARSD